MKKIYKWGIPVLATLFVVAGVSAFTFQGTPEELKDIQGQESNLGGGFSTTYINTALDETSASSTSSSINIDGADRITLAFTVADVTGSGLATSTFAVEVSVDDVNYVTYNKLIDNVINTNAQDLTRVASVAIDSNSTKLYSMDLTSDNFMFMRITDVIIGTTTASVTAQALIEN